MSRNLQEHVHVWPVSPGFEALDAYEQAFVQTVLRLHGVEGTPTPLQTALCRKILRLRGLRVAIEEHCPQGAAAGAPDLAQGRSAGVEQAFMLVRFDSVLPADALQLQSLRNWLESSHAAD